MPNGSPAQRPQWWKIVLLPSWLGHALEFFGLVMLFAFPVAVATGDTATRWLIFAVSLVFSVLYGLYAARRITRTVVASDPVSYTVRLEWIPRRTRRTERRADP